MIFIPKFLLFIFIENSNWSFYRSENSRTLIDFEMSVSISVNMYSPSSMYLYI
jgi:hypothetical protein